jgi:hypothetical protein
MKNKAKLIKLNLANEYRVDDEKGCLILKTIK